MLSEVNEEENKPERLIDPSITMKQNGSSNGIEHRGCGISTPLIDWSLTNGAYKLYSTTALHTLFNRCSTLFILSYAQKRHPLRIKRSKPRYQNLRSPLVARPHSASAWADSATQHRMASTTRLVTPKLL